MMGAMGNMGQKIGRKAVERVLGGMTHGLLEVVDARDGSVFTGGPGDPGEMRVRIEVHDQRFYPTIALRGSSGAGEAYMNGWWTCKDPADLVELLILNYGALRSMEKSLAVLVRPLRRLRYWMERNTRTGSRKNIHRHYDLSNEFFALWLDESMTYSSGIFEQEGCSLADAQFEKLDRACRKLELAPNDHLLEIGTGWGSMALHAARHYGCRVTTTTISDRQHEIARRRIDEAGLSDRITLLKRDYRDLEGSYDKLVSIEMIEAVGWQHLPLFMQRCCELLKPDGQALIQAITIKEQAYERAKREHDFLKRHIFPGSCLLSIGAITQAMRTSTDFNLLHIEDIGRHYGPTLRAWRDAFFERIDEVRALGFDERFIRMWDFYYCYSEGAFRARHAQDYQILLARAACRRDTPVDRGQIPPQQPGRTTTIVEPAPLRTVAS